MKEDLKNIEWYINYHPSITEEIFNRFINYLVKNKFKKHKHCSFIVSYGDFKDFKFIRNGVGDKDDGDKYFLKFCIDNNHQGYKNEIDIFNYQEVESNYEIY